MPAASALVDSSFLIALYKLAEPSHAKVAQFVRTFTGTLIIPDVILPEVTFLLNRSGGQPATELFLQSLLRAQPRLEPLRIDDIDRVHDILKSYPDARFDFVDCCLMALAERHDITQICTLDRRDFSIFRPHHCDYFTLLP